MMRWMAIALGALCAIVASAACAQYEGRFKVLNHEAWRKGWPAGPDAPEVLDRKTNLVWRRGFEEIRFSDGNGKPYFSWDEAVARASFVAAETGKPWRLPSIGELAALVKVAKDDRLKEKADIDFFFSFKTELRHIWIWSGTSHADPKFAWYVNYNFGTPAYYYREYQGRARLVRPAEPGDFSGGQCNWVRDKKKPIREGKNPILVCPPG